MESKQIQESRTAMWVAQGGQPAGDSVVQDIREGLKELAAGTSKPATGTDIPLQCLDCCFGFDSVQSAKAHFLQVHGRVFGPSDQPLLPNYLLGTQEEGPRPRPKFQCYVRDCPESFITIPVARAHLAWAHDERPGFLGPCSTCGLLFSSVKDLNQHEQSLHSKSSLDCPVCGLKFKDRNGVLGHVRAVHGPVAVDSQRSEKELRAAALMGPQRKAGRGPTFYCFCGSQFSNRRKLESHKAKAHKVPCKVPWCRLSFRSVPKMWKHMEQSHPSRKVQ